VVRFIRLNYSHLQDTCLAQIALPVIPPCAPIVQFHLQCSNMKLAVGVVTSLGMALS
jgi:hypothetical protein